MPWLRAPGLLVLLAVLGCDAGGSTSVVLQLEAGVAARDEAKGLRIRVWDHDLELRSDETLGEVCDADAGCITEIDFPVELPLVPRDGDAARTFGVQAELLDAAGRPLSLEGGPLIQRLVGGYRAGDVERLTLPFEACGRCPRRQTCRAGGCVDACLGPSPDECMERVWSRRPCVVPLQGSGLWAGEGFACALDARDGLWCWGENGSGQLGAGDGTDRPEPVRVQIPGEGSHWLACPEDAARCARAAAGTVHACAIDTEGALWCWGANTEGQLGVDSREGSGIPVQVPEGSWTAVGAGVKHTCGVQRDGSLWCWGNNPNGQLGLGHEDDVELPQRVGENETWVRVEGGGQFSCGLRRDGSLWCWGGNFNGQLGTGDRDPGPTPRQAASMLSFVDFSLGAAHVCAITEDRALYCWGHNDRGQVTGMPPAEGENEAVLEPVRFSTSDGTSSEWRSVGAASDGSCAVRGDGALWCWGARGDMAPGDGPMQLGTGSSWQAVSSGDRVTCALDEHDNAWCWGEAFEAARPACLPTSGS